jgi:hypothetical protein
MKLARSLWIYLGLMAYLVAVKLAIDLLFPPTVFASPSQAGVFAWPALGIWTVAGLLGVWLAHRTGFPGLWDKEVNMPRWLLLAAILGLGFGIIDCNWDYATGASRLAAERMGIPAFHIPFPASAVIYPGGAIIVEVLYRLVPIPLVVFLVSNLLLRGRWQNQVFWVAAIVLSAFEPVSQSGLLSLAFGREFKMRGLEGLVAGEVIKGYALNLTEAYLFRKAGFLAPLVLRVVYYLLWHVAWGSLQS